MTPSAALGGAAVAALVTAGAWRWRPPPGRVRALSRTGPVTGGRRPLFDSAFASVGRGALRLARRPPTDDASARRVGRALVAAVPVALVAPAAAPAMGLAVWLLPAHRRRRRQAAGRRAVREAVPEAVDLFSLAVSAGLTVPLALDAVAGRAPAPLEPALRHAVGKIAVGARVADVLDGLPDTLGEPVRPLVAALVASDRYGVPLAASLDRLAGELRADRRRAAEEAARRVPIKLLFPLVVCILPAFALLTVVPLAASALGSLRL